MQPAFKNLLTAALLLACGAAAHAAGALFKVPTRPDVSTAVFWESVEGATATVLLFPGGGGGFGRLENGRPNSRNFLVRSVPLFLAQGLNVAIIGKPGDKKELDYADRITDAHMTDVRKVIEFVKGQSSAPVWLMGTSRGTVSATAAAIHLKPQIAGLVLTSSVVNYSKPGAVPKQDLAAITVPVLVVHHSKDACAVCRPHEVPAILRGLANAPVKKLVMEDGGANPSGDPCEALHWHGFIGMEPQVVDTIGSWIRHPEN